VERSCVGVTAFVLIPATVETKEDAREAEEIYPAVPKPATVEMKLLACPTPITVEIIVDCSSVGSMKLLIYFSRPAVVDNKLLVRPVVVEIRVGVDRKSEVR